MLMVHNFIKLYFGQMCCAGSDKEDHPSQGRLNGFHAQAMAPTIAQPLTPGFLDAGPSQEEGAPPLPCASVCCFIMCSRACRYNLDSRYNQCRHCRGHTGTVGTSDIQTGNV